MSRILAALAVAAVTLTAPLSARAQSVGSVCKDGTTDTHTGRGACSRHGGVDKDATAKAVQAAKDSVKAAKAQARAAKAQARASAKAQVAAQTPVGPKVNASTTTNTNATSMLGKPKKTASVAASTGASASTSSGESVNNDPSGATAKCKDGTYSHAKTHQGACSRHGGVAQWLKS